MRLKNMYLDLEKWDQAIAELCPEINDLLNLEQTAGNQINGIYQAEQVEMSGWLKAGTIIVYMEKELFTNSSSLPAEVTPGGPDYQCGIYRFYQCGLHCHLLMESHI